MSTIKILKKVAIKVPEATPGSYETPTMLMPFTAFSLGRAYDVIEDESIVGVAFKDLPLQGVRKQEGNMAGQVDVISIEPILELAMGTNATKVFTLPIDKNEKSASICAMDSVKHVKFAGVYAKTLKITSSAEKALDFSLDLLGWTLEDRASSGFPESPTAPGERLQHRHAGGTGYIRMGDHTDALSAVDDLCLESWELNLNWQFDNQFDNCSQGTKVPLSGAGGRPVVEFSGKLSRHGEDDLLAFRDAFTKMQAELYVYASATANLKFQIPNFVLSEVSISEDDIARVEFKAIIGRNGMGTSYQNANMAFVSPLKITLVNS